MNETEAYSFLFTDTLFSNLIFILHTELAIDVMNLLGSYKRSLIFTFASLGYFVSVILNYVFGMVLYNLYKFSNDEMMHYRYDKFKEFFHQFGIFIIFLCFIPSIGKFFIILAGFTRYNIIKTIIYASMSKMLYYFIVIYY